MSYTQNWKVRNLEKCSFPSNIDRSGTFLLILFINIKLKFERGMSSFLQLIITILKIKPDKLLPRIIKYRDYKTTKPQVNLKNMNNTNDMNNSSFIEIKSIFMELLNKAAPLKRKYLRANYSKFTTMELSKSIMLRTKLRNHI